MKYSKTLANLNYSRNNWNNSPDNSPQKRNSRHPKLPELPGPNVKRGKFSPLSASASSNVAESIPSSPAEQGAEWRYSVDSDDKVDGGILEGNLEEKYHCFFSGIL